MRVLLAVHAFPPRSTAGVEVYTLRLAQALAARGHELRVLSAVHDLADAPYALRRRSQAGVEVSEIVSVHPRGTLRATYDDPAIDASARAVLAEFRPQCVHVQHLLNLSWGLAREARAVGARVLFTLHDYWLSCPRDGLRMRADLAVCAHMDHRVCATCLTDSPYLVPPLQRGLAGAARGFGFGRQLHLLHARAPRLTETVLRLLRHATPAASQAGLSAQMDQRAAALRAAARDVDLFLAPTAFMHARALEFGIAASRLRVQPYGALPEPARARPAGARRRFGFVGSLAPHKGVHVLIEAFRGLSDPDVTLDVHGSPATHPAYAEALRRAAESDPRIRWRGAFAEGQQGRVLQDLDALVVPSVWWEHSPISVLEGLSAGLVVVASNTGGVPELIPAGAGLLVPPGDALALRTALAALASGASLSESRPALALKTCAEEAAQLEELYTGV